MAARDDRAGLGGGAPADRGRRRRQRLARAASRCGRGCTASRRTAAWPRGWNTGIELARAPVIAVLNSDCMVEPGWDEALYEAATTGRRIAFPYTDHCDGAGLPPARPGRDRGLVLHADRARCYDEIGRFDERFNPAYCEDTDYWHRAWELGIELSPVPQARVVHARRTSASGSRRLAADRPPLPVRLEARRRADARAAVLQPRDRRVPRPVRDRRGWPRPHEVPIPSGISSLDRAVAGERLGVEVDGSQPSGTSAISRSSTPIPIRRDVDRLQRGCLGRRAPDAPVGRAGDLRARAGEVRSSRRSRASRRRPARHARAPVPPSGSAKVTSAVRIARRSRA